MRHRWNNDVCVNCGVTREKQTIKFLMAITFNGRSHYQYEQKYLYSRNGVNSFIYAPCNPNKL